MSSEEIKKKLWTKFEQSLASQGLSFADIKDGADADKTLLLTELGFQSAIERAVIVTSWKAKISGSEPAAPADAPAAGPPPLSERETQILASGFISLLVELPSHTNLFSAAKAGDVASIKTLLAAGANKDEVRQVEHERERLCRNFEGCGRWCTPLGIAVFFGQLEVLKALLEAGAKCDSVEVPNQREMVFDPRQKPSMTQPPLVIAVWGKRIEIVKLLLAAKAKVDVVSDCGNYPIAIAAHLNSIEIVRLLVAAGANVNCRGASGGPLHEAVRADCTAYRKVTVMYGREEVEKMQSYTCDRLLSQAAEMVRLLLNAGADKDAQGNGNQAGHPLYQAASNARLETVRILVNAGAKIEQEWVAHINYGTALVAAVGACSQYDTDQSKFEIEAIEVVKYLLASGANKKGIERWCDKEKVKRLVRLQIL